MLARSSLGLMCVVACTSNDALRDFEPGWLLPEELDLGQVQLGTSTQRSFEIRSTGSGPLALESADLPPGGLWLQGELPRRVAPGEGAVFVLYWTPSAEGPARDA